MKVVCVTGGTGFVGQHLVSCLVRDGEQVRVLTRHPEVVRRLWPKDSVEPWPGDLTMAETLRGFTDKASVVYHFGGEIQDARYFEAVNVAGTRNLLKACCQQKILRFVHLSSVGIIGADGAVAIDETSPCHPQNAYEKSKHNAELIVLDAFSTMQLPVIIIRPTIIFGEGLRRGHDSFAAWMKAIETGRFRFIGSNDAVANYIYVKDVVEVCLRLADTVKAIGQVYIVSDSCSIRAFVGAATGFLGVKMSGNIPTWLAYVLAIGFETVGRLTGFTSPLTLNRIKALRSQVKYSGDKVMQDLGFFPEVGWYEGLRRTIKWYKQNKLLLNETLE